MVFYYTNNVTAYIICIIIVGMYLSDLLLVIFKMLLATIVGMLVGLERNITGKDAGLRTHAILCLATCSLTCLTNSLIFDQVPRVIACIIQGVGFLGAGVIFLKKETNAVKGLTSSVIIWLVAIIGIICGTDHWYYVLPLLICYIFICTVGERLERKYKINKKTNNYEEM